MTTIQVTAIDYLEPALVAAKFAHATGTIFLDSAAITDDEKYSFIGIDPFLTLTSKNGKTQLNDIIYLGNPFALLKQKLAEFSTINSANNAPFQGGAMGFFSYDLCQHLEKIPRQYDDLQFPDMAIGFYDLVIGFNQQLKQAWIFASGFPATSANEKNQRIQQRGQWLLTQLSTIKPNHTSDCLLAENSSEIKIWANFSEEHYTNTVQRVIDYIYAGDIFQANLSQRFNAKLPSHLTPFQLYCRLRAINPAPFAAYMNISDTILASASPERFLKLQGDSIETCPIKGTRIRHRDKIKDQLAIAALKHSEKDRAENIMIVDLLRNDLSRVCTEVEVKQLCEIESFATVHHLVSKIQAKLKPQLTAIDLLQATFPGGSITGAPKIRAMEIIAELEPTQRGPYCGCFGYLGFDGAMDTAITIRSYAIKNNFVTFQAGGGIVADSEPLTEYRETLLKARALHQALNCSPNYDFIDR